MFYSTEDWMINLLAGREEYLDGFAHEGMLKASRTIMQESSETLQQAFETYPDYKLVVTGHSLGAGCSILISLGILAGEFEEIVPSSALRKCIALAPPMCYRQDDNQDFPDEIVAFLNGNNYIVIRDGTSTKSLSIERV